MFNHLTAPFSLSNPVRHRLPCLSTAPPVGAWALALTAVGRANYESNRFGRLLIVCVPHLTLLSIICLRCLPRFLVPGAHGLTDVPTNQPFVMQYVGSFSPTTPPPSRVCPHRWLYPVPIRVRSSRVSIRLHRSCWLSRWPHVGNMYIALVIDPPISH